MNILAEARVATRILIFVSAKKVGISCLDFSMRPMSQLRAARAGVQKAGFLSEYKESPAAIALHHLLL